MIAISVKQPDAGQLASGISWITQRDWIDDYRGPIAIHAAGRSDVLTKRELLRFPVNAVIAVGELAAVVRYGAAFHRQPIAVRQLIESGFELDDFLQAAEPIAERPFCFCFRNVQKLETPIWTPGRRKLWKLPRAIAGGIGEHIRMESNEINCGIAR